MEEIVLLMWRLWLPSCHVEPAAVVLEGDAGQYSSYVVLL
jgi:hypothetical protein